MGGGGLGRAKNIGALFLDFKPLFKSSGRKEGAQNPNTSAEANKMKFYAVMSHLEKCRDFCVKVLRNCPK